MLDVLPTEYVVVFLSIRLLLASSPLLPWPYVSAAMGFWFIPANMDSQSKNAGESICGVSTRSVEYCARETIQFFMESIDD